MLLTLKATLYSVLASLSGNLTPYLSTTPAPQTHPHPQLPVIFPGAIICLCHLQESHLDPQVNSFSAPPRSLTQSEQVLPTWNDSIAFPPALWACLCISCHWARTSYTCSQHGFVDIRDKFPNVLGGLEYFDMVYT